MLRRFIPLTETRGSPPALFAVMEPTPRQGGGAGGEYVAAPISAESTAAQRTDRRQIPRAYRERLDSRRERLRSRARELGPGLITGAADDDPSGIASYSQAGAAFGYATLWVALVTLPLMAAVQLMCARIGIVTRSGLASVLREHYPRWLLWLACSLLLLGNTINIAADLGGMAAAAGLLTGLPASWFVPAFTGLIMGLLVF